MTTFALAAALTFQLATGAPVGDLQEARSLLEHDISPAVAQAQPHPFERDAATCACPAAGNMGAGADRGAAQLKVCHLIDDFDMHRTVRDGLHTSLAFANDTFTANWDLREYYDEETGETYYPFVFSKTLRHEPLNGMVRKADLEKLLAAVRCPTSDTINDIPRSGSAERKLEGFANSHSRNLIGFNPRVPVAPTTFPVDSTEQAFEMAEVYAMALARDIPFSDFETNPTIATLVHELNKFSTKTTAPVNFGSGHITPKLLFRGDHPGEAVGPYVSQFLVHSYNYGNLPVEQKYLVEQDPDPNDTVRNSGYLAMQDGRAATPPVTSGRKFAHAPRVLGSMVHNDPLYQLYYTAALIAVEQGIAPTGIDSDVTTPWTSAGDPDVYASVAHVAEGAMRVAWWNKWGVNMRIRPEAMAYRYQVATWQERARSNPALAAIKDNLDVADGLMDMVREHNRARLGHASAGAFLNVQYPEGSPTHPALPAGHATVAGACATVLKAMLTTFDDDEGKVETKWLASGRSALHSRTGSVLETYDDSDRHEMTVNGELNKLASNIALGRDMAGVHYRLDGKSGMLLGEQYAISYLVSKVHVYREAQVGLFNGWTLQKFDGTVIRIDETGAIHRL